MTLALPIYDDEFNSEKIFQRGESFLHQQTNCKNANACAEPCWQDTNVAISSIDKNSIDNFEAYFWTVFKRFIITHSKNCSICDEKNISIDSLENPEILLSKSTCQKPQTQLVTESLIMIEKFYNSLSSENRVIFEMAFYERRGSSEIAQYLMIEDATVRKRISRLKKQFVEYFK